MLFISQAVSRAGRLVLLGAMLFSSLAPAQSNVTVRIMAANLNGNSQTYEPFAIRIFQGLQPDIVAIQEFNYSNNTASDFRSMVDTAFGTNFVYYREPYNGGGDIPNGIISRYPIVASGSWTDTAMSSPNRGFAWAQIDLPGTNDLYVVSVHLLTTSATARGTEAANLKALIQASFPANAWVVVAGDFNTDTRTESPAMPTFKSFLSDNPIPVDDVGNSDTSQNRNHPHDYVLPAFSLTNLETATLFPTHTYPAGLVFDSRVYSNLSDFSPVQSADSGLAQHMAVLKDFSIPAGIDTGTNPPAIITQPQGQTNAAGATITFNARASGSGALAWQWQFNGTNIDGATTNPLVLVNAQLANNGIYSVMVTNLYGSATSSNAVLLLTNAPPAVTTPPQSQAVLVGQTATLGVTATGTPPLGYQWLFNGSNISGAVTNPFLLANVQLTNAGNYSVVITNVAGSVTSSPASLTVLFTNPAVFAQWNFNSVTPDSDTTTGSTAPSLGSGTASMVGGVTANGSGFATGNTTLDPAGSTDNSAWNTTSYPASGNNLTAGVQFAVSTAGLQNILVSWSQQSSKTGGKYFRLRYSTNSGASFTDYPTAVTLPLATNFYAFTNDLSATPGVGNNSNFIFRIVAEFQSTATGSGTAGYVAAGTGSTYASSGTTRFDMVSVTGISYIAAAPAVLTPVAFIDGQFSLAVSGSSGADYVVLTSTNLAAANWTPVFTNASPFVYTDSIPAAPQKFYRAAAQQ
ncbi:MAG TPA: immunoglobulin domain-containing protein [Candidatus Acidoferrum sp.]|nr:immunoglobulin domain-containing protein [Candidatus Acidoferrum sp.]